MEWNAEIAAAALAKMRGRYSCRAFDGRDVPEDILNDIIQTGLCAASGGNLQPYSIVVIRDKASAKKICTLCEDQKFIEEAPVNLLFLLDWHKMGEYARAKDAPFVCNESYMHFLIALEDVMCAAQTIETAAHLMGLGSCYVGNSNHCGHELSKEFNLPKHTYPVILLSMGYPKAKGRLNAKLPAEVMVFNERYPDAAELDIIAAYDKKYGEKFVKLPEAEPYRSDMLGRLHEALLTTYREDKALNIVNAIAENKRLHAVVRIFGLHYEAGVIRELGKDVLSQMSEQGLRPFRE